MKKLLLLSLVCTAFPAFAQNYAEVVSRQPRYVVVNQQQCRQVAVQRSATDGNTAGALFGTIAGAAIGNQIGGGNGKTIATAAGAVLGHQLGKGESQPGRIEYQQVCDIVPQHVQQGETVTFRYNGVTFTQTFD